MSSIPHGARFPARVLFPSSPAQELAPLTGFLKEAYGSKVEKVAVSHRLGAAPMVLVSSQYGWSANMERIMKGQAFADPKQAQYMSSRKVAEINPYHPLIKALNSKVAAGQSDAVKDQAALLFDAALLQSGFAMEKPEDFAARLHRVLNQALDVPADASVEAEPEADLPDEVPAAAPAADAAAAAGDAPAKAKDEL